MLVRYRFDDDPAYSGNWAALNPPHDEYSVVLDLDDEIAMNIADGIHDSEQLIYEIDGFRILVDFSQPESQNAVLDIKDRCSQVDTS